MEGEKTVSFCSVAEAFLRWRMYWEGSGAPRLLFSGMTKDPLGLIGWLAESAPVARKAGQRMLSYGSQTMYWLDPAWAAFADVKNKKCQPKIKSVKNFRSFLIMWNNDFCSDSVQPPPAAIVNIPLSELEQRWSELPKDWQIVVGGMPTELLLGIHCFFPYSIK